MLAAAEDGSLECAANANAAALLIAFPAPTPKTETLVRTRR
jgi:hypothetical protein